MTIIIITIHSPSLSIITIIIVMTITIIITMIIIIMIIIIMIIIIMIIIMNSLPTNLAKGVKAIVVGARARDFGVEFRRGVCQHKKKVSVLE